MRILLMHHFPLAQSETGGLVAQWLATLAADGHDARLLLVDDHADPDEVPRIERIVCREGDPSADLNFAVPRFSSAADAGDSLTFAALSDRQLADYRDRLRRRLDRIIDRFDPDVLHVQHLWVQGQLALETGVPYVVSAWREELFEYDLDARYRSLVDQAAENASRIIVPDQAMFAQVMAKLEGANECCVVMDAKVSSSQRLLEIYQSALDDRFGAGSR